MVKTSPFSAGETFQSLEMFAEVFGLWS